MQRVLLIDVKKIILSLIILALMFSAVTLLADYLKYNVQYELPRAAQVVFKWFHLSQEKTAATWFGSLLLFLCAGSVAITTALKAAHSEPYHRYWLGLAMVLLAFSVDEIAGIHEAIQEPLKLMFEPVYYLRFTWVVAGIVVVCVLALLFLRFWLHLPSRTRWLFTGAALLYFGGSIGLEMVGANIYYLRNGPSFRYDFVAVWEELAEMLGAILFLYANLDYLSRYAPEFGVVSSLRQRED